MGASSSDFEGRSAEVEILIAGGPEDAAREVEAIVREVSRDVPASAVRVTSGFEALETLLDRDLAVAVILPELDGLSGLQLARLIRKHRSLESKPLILVSPGADDAVSRSGLGSGPIEVEALPVRPAALRSRISVFAQLAHARAEGERLRERLREARNARRRERNQDTVREKEFERELVRRTREFYSQARDLERLVVEAAHDLTEPLRTIGMIAQKLEGEDASRIARSSHRLQALVGGVLDLARARVLPLRRSRVDLGVVAREVVEDLGTLLHESSGRVEIGDLPSVEADPAGMRQVLQNLVSNSLKFRRDEEPPVVRIRAEVVRRVARIVVEDNGTGFDPAQTERIFRPFERLHPRSRYPGSGIGLSVCKRVVESHGGTIGARSQPGVGTAFIVEIPIEAAETARPAEELNGRAP